MFTIPILAFTMSDLGVHVAPIHAFTFDRSGRSRSPGTRSLPQRVLLKGCYGMPLTEAEPAVWAEATQRPYPRRLHHYATRGLLVVVKKI